MILKSETYHFHQLDLTRQAGFIVTIYDGGRPAARQHHAANNASASVCRGAQDRRQPDRGADKQRAKGLPVETMCGLTQAYTWRELVALYRLTQPGRRATIRANAESQTSFSTMQ